MEMAVENILGNERVSEAPTSEEPKRGRGRPKGLPKTGGRQKGGKNWTNEEIRSALLGKSEAIETLADICAGRLMRVSGPTGKDMDVYPSMQERLKAVELVLKKVVPDLQAQSIELTGRDGAPLIPDDQDHRQLSRAILAVLGEAVLDDAPASEPMPAPRHLMTATRFEEVDEVDALDLSDEPSRPSLVDESGETETVGNRGDFIQCLEVGRDGRSKWAIHDRYGTRHVAMWGTREAARVSCQEFIATGSISR